jgi:hypothetical protein
MVKNDKYAGNLPSSPLCQWGGQEVFILFLLWLCGKRYVRILAPEFHPVRMDLIFADSKTVEIAEK